MAWSEAQLAAIETRGKNILVAAAAGSGKTSVLVERIIRRLLDESQPVDIDKILVVTFTSAAAAEMRARIAAALNAAQQQNPFSQHIERQVALINSAPISTIHAFCQNIIRQNFHLLDIDPKFRIGGQGEITLMQNDVLENLFENRYAQGDAAFLELVEHYGDEQSDATLQSLVLDLYEFSRSHPWPAAWLSSLTEPFALPDDADFDQQPWSLLLRQKIILELEAALQLAQGMAEECGRGSGVPAYEAAFASDANRLEEVLAAARHSWQQLSCMWDGFSFVRLPAAPKDTDLAAKEYAKEQRENIKKAHNACRDQYFSRTAEDMLADMRRMAPVIAALAGLVQEFASCFAAAKQEKSLLDFSDLEHLCLQILLAPHSRPGQEEPSAAAAALRARYAEVMVDEYQDTNGVQETILRLIASTERGNLFLVGDVKQSIYRFRLAEPELFMEKYRRYPAAGSAYRRIDLSQNFRSRPGVLAAINFLFAQLMVPAVAELEYGVAEQLNPGPDYPEAPGLGLDGPVEVYLVGGDGQAESAGGENDNVADTEESQGDEEGTGKGEEDGVLAQAQERSSFELEARFIAGRIAELMTEDRQVYDKEIKGYRRLAWRDIVILLRSPRNKAGVLLEVLRHAAIPAYAEADDGYFREIEVQIMLSLLSVIDNPRQDIPLAAALRSPLGGFSAAELARLRLLAPAGDLWDALCACRELPPTGELQSLWEKTETFSALLEGWRQLARRGGVPELIWQVYRDTGYYDYVGGMAGGALRQANLRALHDRARQYEATNFRGLFRFLRFLERMQDKGSDLAVARVLGESEDVVRIMSIHKSKGLEFPVVFVADMGKNINLQDSKAVVLTHKVLGVGPYVTEPELRLRYPTIARQAIAHKMTMETKAEELRVLYVALTRAREKLILVGTVKKLEKKAVQWCRTAQEQAVQLPASLVGAAKSYLDWLGPALVRHPQGELLRQAGEFAGQIPSWVQKDSSRWQINAVPAAGLKTGCAEGAAVVPQLEAVRRLETAEGGEDYAWVERSLGWQYPYQRVVGKAAKLSVSEIKRRFDLQQQQHSQALYESRTAELRPRFIQQQAGLTGAELGTLMHSVMQHIDLAGETSEEAIASQLQDMARREIILPEHVPLVNVRSIAAFFQTDIGRRLRAADRVWRELPFSLMLPAERFDAELFGAGEGVFIQGVIDVLFSEGGKYILLDYKTDRLKDEKELAGRYRVQLNLYGEAVEKIFGGQVAETYLYSFHGQQAIKL